MTTPIPNLPTLITLGIVQGQTYSLTVTWTDGGNPATALSMAGRYAHMSVRNKVGGAGIPVIDSYSNHITRGADSTNPEDGRLITGTTADITQEPSGQTGKLVVRLPATATAALRKVSTVASPAYWFDLYTISSTDPTDAVQLATGIVAVRNSVATTLTVPPS